MFFYSHIALKYLCANMIYIPFPKTCSKCCLIRSTIRAHTPPLCFFIDIHVTENRQIVDTKWK